jgi:hypothetical protein
MRSESRCCRPNHNGVHLDDFNLRRLGFGVVGHVTAAVVVQALALVRVDGSVRGVLVWLAYRILSCDGLRQCSELVLGDGWFGFGDRHNFNVHDIKLEAWFV